MKRLRLLWLLPLAALLLLAWGRLWLTGDGGRLWLSEWLSAQSGGMVQIDALTGDPLADVQAARLTLSGDGWRLTLVRPHLRWQPWPLLSSQLKIEQLSAAAARLELLADGTSGLSKPTALPFDLDLADIRIERLELRQPDDEPLLAGPAVGSHWRYSDRLSGALALALNDGELRGVLSGRKSDWHLHLAGKQETIGGDIDLGGSRLDRGNLRTDLHRGDDRIRLAGEWQWPQALQLAGTLHAELAGTDSRVSWRAAMQPDGSRMAMLAGHTLQPQLSRPLDWKLHASQSTDKDWWLMLNESGERLVGKLDAEDNGWRLALKLHDWPLPLTHSGALAVALGGDADLHLADDGRWQARAALADSRIAGTPASLALAADGADDAWRVGSIAIDAAGAHLSGNAAGSAQQSSGSLHLAVRDLAQLLSRFDLSGKGELSADLNWSGPFAARQGQFVARLSQAEVNGVRLSDAAATAALRDNRFEMASNGAGDWSWQLALDGVSIDGNSWQGNLRTAALAQGEHPLLDLAGSRWRFDPEFGGALSGDGRLLDSPLSLNLSADRDRLAGQLEAPAVPMVRLQPWLPPELALEPGDLTLLATLSGSMQQPRAVLTLLANHPLHLNVSNRPLPPLHIAQVILDVDGRQLHWQGGIAANGLTLDFDGTALWQLSFSPWRYRAPVLDRYELHGVVALLQPWLPSPAGGEPLAQPALFSLRNERGRLQGRLSADAIDLAPLAARFDPQLAAQGSCRLSVALGGTTAEPQLDLSAASLGDLSLAYGDRGAQSPTPFMLNRIHLHSDGKALDYQVQLTSGSGSLTAAGATDWHLSVEPLQLAPPSDPGTFSLSGRLESLALLRPLLADNFDPLAGNARFDLQRAQSQLLGSANVELERLGVVDLGLDLSGQLHSRWIGNGAQFEWNLRSGSGTLALFGDFDPDQARYPTLKLDRFQLVQTPNLAASASGELALHDRPQGQVVRGILEADDLRIHLADSLPGVTPDLLLDSRTQAAEEYPEWMRLTALDVQIEVSEASTIDGRGVSMHLAGPLQLGGTLNDPRLRGRLRVASGAIDFGGVALEIQPESFVGYDGSSDAATLFIKATRPIEHGMVGILLEGNSDQPQTRLISQPAMSDSEILAWLVTGRPLAAIGQSGTQDAVGFAAFLFGAGARFNALQQKMQRSLGLDEVRISASGDSGTVSVGKRFGNRAMLRIEETMSARSTTVTSLEYELAQGLSLFARYVQNIAPTVGIKLSREWFKSR